MTQEQLFSEEIVEDLFSLEGSDRIMRKRELINESKKLNCKTDFEKFISEFEKDEKKYSKSNKVIGINANININNDKLTNFSYPHLENQLICTDFSADDNGITKLEFTKDGGIKQKLLTYSPIFPLEMYKDIDTEQYYVKIVYKTTEWQEKVIEKEVLSVPSKIQKLGGTDINIPGGKATELSDYFNCILAKNSDRFIPKLTCSKFGWKGENFKDFIPYVGNYDFDSVLSTKFKPIADAMKPKGNYNKWKENMIKQRAVNRKEFRLTMATSFASPLLEICDVQGFWTHLWGLSGAGKSVCLMAAASIWANPNMEKSAYIQSFNSTQVFSELRSGVLTHLPVIMDDTAIVADKLNNDFTQLIYSQTDYQGRGRANKELGTNKSQTWHLCTISSGENTIINSNSKGGAINRVIDIECEDGYIFGDDKNTREFANNILKSNYGYAGREFINFIINYGAENIYNEFDEYRNIISDKLEKMGNNANKWANSVAMLLFADKLATDVIFCDNNYMDVDEYLHFLLDSKEIMDEGERAYMDICDEIKRNTSHFVHITNSINKIVGTNVVNDRWGIIEYPNSQHDYTTVYLENEPCSRLLKKIGIDKKKLKNFLNSKNLLIADVTGGKQSKVMKIDGKSIRTLAFKVFDFKYVE